MQTGILIPDEIRERFQEMRMKRKHRYIILKPSDSHDSVVIEKVGERNETWEQFQEAMPKNNSR
jgi:cofilin